MSFAVFRKYEKPLLAVAVVFTVAVFAFFPSMGDIQDAVGGRPSAADLMGSFTVATTGEAHDVSLLDFRRASQSLERFRGGRSDDYDEAVVWRHLMLLEDARGAGIRVTDAEIGNSLKSSFPPGTVTPEFYASLWRDRLQFASARAFEQFFRETLMVQRWVEALESGARVVDADSVYQRWRVDNELFDLDVLVFADAEPDSIADPGDEQLLSFFDEMPDYLRERRFVDPARYDLALAWVALDAASENLPSERLAELPPVTEAEIDARFKLLKPSRFPELDEADEDTRALLRSELLVIGLATAAHREWVALGSKPVEGPVQEGVEPPPRTAQEFVDFMASWGLTSDDPTGMLGPEELEALPEVGSPNLAARLLNTRAGDSRYFKPYGEETRALVLFVEDVEAETPLGFEDARDQVLEAWRSDPVQVAGAANDFRDELKARARQVDEAAEVLAEFEQLASDAADERIAAETAAAETAAAEGSESDDVATLQAPDAEAQAAIREEELEAVAFDIQSRLAPYEHRAWDELAEAALADGRASERVSFAAVSKSWRLQNTDAEVDRTTLEYYVKSNGRVFQLAVDTLSDVLRHITAKQSVVVRVTARAFPEMSVMLADNEGMEKARLRLSTTAAAEFQLELLPERLLAPRSDSNPWGHGLRVVRAPEPEGQVDGEADAEGEQSSQM